MDNKRAELELVRELFDTVPVERIVAAAGYMMRWRRTDLPPDAAIEPTRDDLIDFISDPHIESDLQHATTTQH
jgi:hypothetical protein